MGKTRGEEEEDIGSKEPTSTFCLHPNIVTRLSLERLRAVLRVNPHSDVVQGVVLQARYICRILTHLNSHDTWFHVLTALSNLHNVAVVSLQSYGHLFRLWPADTHRKACHRIRPWCRCIVNFNCKETKIWWIC